MASTQPHNAQADARFIARGLPLCRPAHATRKEMSRATSKRFHSRRREKKAAATVRHACLLSKCGNDVLVFLSRDHWVEGDYLGKRESTRKPYHAHGAARVSPEWLAVQGVGRKGHRLPAEGRPGGARQTLGDTGDGFGAGARLKGCKRGTLKTRWSSFYGTSSPDGVAPRRQLRFEARESRATRRPASPSSPSAPRRARRLRGCRSS